jgi:5-methylcytosine-specific restriction endonuclease McrBC GTP-binding regulatory subunit McrB
MNRANIARVFGELMFLLEYRDKSIQLMIDNRDYSLPPNLIIIGTMNTVDRSARSLDIAMRRRFRFFQLLPDVEVLKNMYSKPNSVLLNDLGQELYTGFEKLNEKLRNELDRHHTIGHSFFIHKRMTKEKLRNIWNQEIFPIIEEYFFDDDKQTAEYSLNAFWPSV